MKTSEHGGLVLLELDPDGPVLSTEQELADLVGEAFNADADIVVVPARRLDPAFFELRSGLAGSLFQKMQNYRRRLAIVGDISAEVAASKALRDFVFETNSVGNHFFVPDRATLLARL